MGNFSNSAKDDGRENCVFCEIWRTRSDRVIYSTDNTFIFHSRTKSGAVERLLVCPKDHIKHAGKLEKNDAWLLLEMRDAGISISERLRPGAAIKMGFHKPPFYSIKHLHLHVVVLPIKGWYFNCFTFGCIFYPIDKEITRLQRKS